MHYSWGYRTKYLQSCPVRWVHGQPGAGMIKNEALIVVRQNRFAASWVGSVVCHNLIVHLLYSLFAASFLLPGPIPLVHPVWNVSDLPDLVMSCAKIFTCWFYYTHLTTRRAHKKASVFWKTHSQYFKLHTQTHITKKYTKISRLYRLFANSWNLFKH